MHFHAMLHNTTINLIQPNSCAALGFLCWDREHLHKTLEINSKAKGENIYHFTFTFLTWDMRVGDAA